MSNITSKLLCLHTERTKLIMLIFFAFSFLTNAQSITSKMNSYRNFDMDSDGIDEIEELKYLSFENDNDGLNSSKKLVLVLVEDRLLDYIPNSSHSQNDLLNRLEQYKDDLRAEGFYTRFISADVYDGPNHQDGLSLLAIRDFLKQINRSWNLQGVVLVGSFPEAMLVRRWIWRRKNWNVNIAGTDYTGSNQRDFLRIVPEIVAHRADIVLADLDGNWENIYEKGPRNLESIEALPAAGTPNSWPINEADFFSSKFNDNTISFQDFFWIKDDNYQSQIAPDGRLRLRIRTSQMHPEISDINRLQSNPISTPEIMVSRINAKNIAVIPDPEYRDSNGKGYLNSSGKPQTIESNFNFNPKSHLKKDPRIERNILIDYFDRNSNFRTGGNPKDAHRTASVKFGSGLINATEFNNYLKKASSSFSTSVNFNDGSLLDYVRMLKTPATLKGFSAHSNSWNSQFGDSYTTSDLERLAGGNPWMWKKSSVGSTFRYTPSFEDLKGTADSYLHRTIFENKILAETGGNLFIHNGCEVNSPGSASTSPYSHNNYGSAGGFQNAESILFFLNGVALASRAKVFYDKPEGFTEEIGKNEKMRFGNGWKAYFTKESADSGLANNVAGNKRTYTWSIIGDWTVRTKYDNGLGLLKVKNRNFEDHAVHANKAWFENWNFESNKNDVKGIGDFNGDGIDDFIVSSAWGIGILYRKNNQWKCLMAKPKNSWLGQWRYNASVNSGKDKIEAVADFDNDGKDEILITSSWGIGILEYHDNNLRSILAKPNGTRFGGWLFNSEDNRIQGTGDFNGDNGAEILISSNWGIGLLKLSGSSLNGLVVKPKNTWFGQWRYNASVNTGKDKIRAIADFNNDGKDNILLTSSWGIGILRFQGNSFNSVMAKPNGTRFGGWLFNSRDNTIEGTGDFNADGKDDIVISSNWGIGLLSLSGSSMNGLVVKPKDTWFGQWRYNASVNRGIDRIVGIADFTNNNRSEILIKSRWGIGILGLSGNTFNSVVTKSYGNQIGPWHLDYSNKLMHFGNFDGQPGQEILVRN